MNNFLSNTIPELLINVFLLVFLARYKLYDVMFTWNYQLVADLNVKQINHQKISELFYYFHISYRSFRYFKRYDYVGLVIFGTIFEKLLHLKGVGNWHIITKRYKSVHNIRRSSGYPFWYLFNFQGDKDLEIFTDRIIKKCNDLL